MGASWIVVIIFGLALAQAGQRRVRRGRQFLGRVGLRRRPPRLTQRGVLKRRRRRLHTLLPHREEVFLMIFTIIIIMITIFISFFFFFCILCIQRVICVVFPPAAHFGHFVCLRMSGASIYIFFFTFNLYI